MKPLSLNDISDTKNIEAFEVLPQYGGILFVGHFLLSVKDAKKLHKMLDDRYFDKTKFYNKKKGLKVPKDTGKAE